ncbi:MULTISPECIES: hypothetical protein [unclassified Ensifer]|uniref:hypothetical protein n=1 Tax=unclassified Ensifer TaxID=2633371 RepID=UPI00070E3BF5|nr:MULTISPECIES: hypothetical protein [unclassified Ensifer]KQW62880.1 hypothetical protein ASD02_01810 [Ensifer sp. Root1252]KRC83701.1 hypothetical protein ASE32_01800 [Ensifer sp. Root231]KRD04054.1 hypothetical protein ASE47_00460 [Ensifer sp. Root258]
MINDTEDVQRVVVRSPEVGRETREAPADQVTGEGDDRWVLDGALEVSRRFEFSMTRVSR